MDENLQDKLDREGLKVASFFKRALAYTIDEFLLSCIVFVIFFNEFQKMSDPLEAVRILGNFSLGLFVLQFSYHAIFTALYGASLGKMICKIIVIDEGILDKPNWGQSCLRALIRQFSGMAFMLGFAWALGNNLRKTWQDYLARTMVIDVA
ncbi:RDD family protein [Campylobacter upsaliensis]|nr:RDD family protein [Campylobacter upsaliensis]EHY5253897.1 RDD family protein [Campylobacter upsaliensis]